MISSVSITGGHLGPSLGVVEITLALHRVFDSPRDRILWDTGHQAYVHKLVTGRQDGFARLRKAGGLVGLPVARGVRARRDREQPRVDRAVLRRRAVEGLCAARREAARRSGRRRRGAHRRHVLGGAEQHRRVAPAGRDRGQRQRPLLRPDHRRAGRAPGDAADDAGLREGPRQGQDDAHEDAGRRAAGLHRAARAEARRQGLPAAAGAVRGPRPEVLRADRRARRAGDGERAAQGARLRRAGDRACRDGQGLRLPAGDRRRGRLPAQRRPGHRPA